MTIIPHVPMECNGKKRRRSISNDHDVKRRKITLSDFPVELTTNIYSFLRESIGPCALPFCLQGFPSHTIPDIIRTNSGEDTVNAADGHGNTAIFYALLHPVYVLDALITAGANVDIKNFKGETILHFFAQQSKANEQHVIRVIQAGMNINARDNLLRTPLHLAMIEANTVLINLLMAHKAEINLRDMHGKTALHMAATAQDNDYVDLLLQNMANVNLQDIDGRTPLHVAAAAESVNVVRFLLQNEADINLLDVSGKTALHFAAATWEKHTVDLLLKSKADVNLRDMDGKTALHVAAATGCDDIIDLLLKNNADVNLRDTNGRTALHYAAPILDENNILILLQHKLDVNLRDKSGKTALHVAVEAGNVDIIRVLLANKADVDLPDVNGKTALHEATAAGDIDSVHVLLEHNADVNWQDMCGKTALHEATTAEDIISVRVLLEHNADTNLQDMCGKTALHVAATSENVDIVRVLLEHNEDVNPQDMDEKRALHLASGVELDALIELKVTGTDVNKKDRKENTPLHGAKPEATQLLIKYGADVNARNRSGKTALHVANRRVAEILVANHAELNVQDRHGRAPLHYAAINSHCSVATLLLDTGANVGLKDRSARTPLHYAATTNDNRILCAILQINHPVFNSYCRTSLSGDIVKHVKIKDACDGVINERDSGGSTPLMCSIKMLLPKSTYALLLRGANPNIAESVGITPLMAAVMNRGKDMDIERTTMAYHIPSALIAYGADCSVKDVSAKTIFHIAAASNLVSTIPVSHSKNINELDADGNTAMHYAIENPTSVTAFIERGADASIPNKDGRTVIHLLSKKYHCWTGYYEIKQILAKDPDLNLNQLDRWGKTALDLARESRIIRILIAAGAIYSDGREPIIPQSDTDSL